VDFSPRRKEGGPGLSNKRLEKAEPVVQRHEGDARVEFLVFLLLGFAAVLLVVPSIIRERLEESPVATADLFQKSMSELGKSLHIDDPRRLVSRAGSGRTRSGAAWVIQDSRKCFSQHEARNLCPRTNRQERLSRAEIRRNRVMAFLLTDSLLWGAVALFTGSFWALVLFTMASLLFALYWLAAFILASTPPRREQRRHEERPGYMEEEKRVRTNLS
jgi:membrane protein implicated in regulation of membrane protease activity